jgi:hypothetical protein
MSVPLGSLRSPIAALATSLACALLATLFVTASPAQARLEADAAVSARTDEVPGVPDACLARPMKCRLSPDIAGAPTLVLWGDSHAWQLIPALKAAIGHRKINLVAFLFGGCPPMDPGLTTPAQVRAAGPCRQTAHKALTYVLNATEKKKDIRLVLAGGWELYRYALDPLEPEEAGWREHTSPSIAGAAELASVGLPRLFQVLGDARVRADVVGQMPTVPENAPECPRSEDPYECDLPRDAALPEAASNRMALKAMVAELRRPAQLIEPSRFFCDSSGCAGRVRSASAWYDDTHISLALSGLLGSYFAGTVQRLLS